MSVAHCDLTEPELGDPISITKSPLQETIKGITCVDNFRQTFLVLQNFRLRSWMPRISKNGDTPRTMQKDSTWFLSDRIEASDATALDVRSQVLQLYHTIFPAEVQHNRFLCQKAHHIAVNNGSKMKAALSYFVHAVQSDVVISHLAVTENERKKGYGTYLLVSLLKSLIGSGRQLPITLYLQCLPSTHPESAMPFYDQFVFSDLHVGVYSENDPFGLNHLSPSVN